MVKYRDEFIPIQNIIQVLNGKNNMIELSGYTPDALLAELEEEVAIAA